MLIAEHPILLAPMAGGPSCPALARAVREAGGVASLAFGYLSPGAAAAQLQEAGSPVAVNLFMPSAPAPGAADAYVARLRDAGLDVDPPRWDDDGFDAKIDLALEGGADAVSVTFGCPTPDLVQRIQHGGAEVWVTVTSVAEARTAVAAGADALIVQGAEAGGHRGSFVDDPALEPIGLLSLLQLVRAAVDVPLVAAGGIATASAVRAMLDAGAALAAAGTAFLLAPEAGTVDAHRALVGTDTPTALTRAFTGRLARGIVNELMIEHGAHAPIAYPEIHYATASLRKRAREAGDASVINLWAGQAHALAVARPAAETVQALAP